MLKKILIVLVVIIAVVAIAAAMQPDDFHYSRNTAIAAPASKIFEQVNILKNWNNWSPWADVDPDAKMTLEGPESGTGAVMSWAGNMDVGEGKMTITESKPNELVKYRLDFVKPMAGTADSDIALKEEGGHTVVTWSMYGKNDFVGKLMSLVMNCEKMMNEQFDKGLAKLKTVAEAK